MSKKINFNDWKQKKAEQHTVAIELSEGRKLTIPPMVLWPPPITDEDGGETNEAYMRRICGEDDYQAFVDDGGTYAMLDAMLTDALGLDTGK